MLQKKKLDLVSVIIPTYNNAAYITEAVDSVLAQDYKNIEIIVVDDGSSDNTGEALDCYSDRIHYVKQSNQGASAARNQGIELAKGEWISFLDSDDRWKGDKISRQIEQLRNCPEAKIHSTNLSIQRNTLDTSDFFESINLPTENEPTILTKPFEFIVRYRYAWLQTTLIHRSIVDKVGYLNTEHPLYEDYEYLARCSLESQWLLSSVPSVEILRRETGSNLSNLRTTKRFESLLRMLEINRLLEKLADSKNVDRRGAKAIRKAIRDNFSSALNFAAKVGDIESIRSLSKEASSYLFPSIIIKSFLYRVKCKFGAAQAIHSRST